MQAKRVIVMLVSAVVFGEDLTFEKKVIQIRFEQTCERVSRANPLESDPLQWFHEACQPSPARQRGDRRAGRSAPRPHACSYPEHKWRTAPQIGSAVAISGVFLYSIVDDLLKPKATKPDAKKM